MQDHGAEVDPVGRLSPWRMAEHSYQVGPPSLLDTETVQRERQRKQPTAGDISPSPGATIAHSKFSRNSRETMRHRSRGGGIVAPT